MSELVVFVSSIMNPDNDNLLAEREAAKSAIESLQLTRSWRFEDSPASSQKIDFAYLNQVSNSDIFILILGKEITAPVLREYNVAAEAEKPRLVFLKESDRSKELQEFLKGIDVKWKSFANTGKLKEEIVAALSEELINGYRRQKIDLDAKDLEKLETWQSRSDAATSPESDSSVSTSNQRGGVNVGAGAQSSGPIAGGNQKNVEIRRAGRDYYEARDHSQIHITNNSSIEEILKLFDAMNSAVDEIDMPAHDKKKVKHAIEGARLEADSDPPDKEAFANRLKEAATIIKASTKFAVEATKFGKLLVKGLAWAGKTLGWLAI